MQNPSKPRWSQVSRTGIVSLTSDVQNRKMRPACARAAAPRPPPADLSSLLAALVVFFLLVRGSRRGSVVGKPVFHLGFDLRQILRLRLSGAGGRTRAP